MKKLDYVKRGSKENTGANIINVYGGKKEYIAVKYQPVRPIRRLKARRK